MTDATQGSFVWYDLLTRDPKEAVAFYSHVIGWTSQPFEGSPYTMFVGSQGPLSGTTELPEQARKMGAPPHWTSNVFVSDVDATVAEAGKLGGRVLVAPSDYPKIGRLAVLADPQGAVINVYKPLNPMQLHDATKPGEFTWSELVTTDHESAFVFYSKLFGWKKVRDHDMGPMGKYLIYGNGGRDLGGMFTKPKDMPMPPAWLYYVQVADLDATLERAKAKGAKVLNGPMEVPGGARIVQLMDPQGAAFALHEPKKSA
jgi:predicted enzyme related to lactoylglutathione lyase